MKYLIAAVLAFLAIVAFVEAKVSPNELLLAEWNEFKATHVKIYESAEQEDRRFQIYLATRKSIAEHNQGHARGIHSYRKAVNKFADIEPDQLASLTGLQAHQPDVRSRSRLTFTSKFNVSALPKSVDWRAKGAVAPVKNQGDKCGSCWAFSTTGSLEGAHAIKTGKLVSLSEKQLVDCSEENQGCNGGFMNDAFGYIIKAGGIESEESYPYVPKVGKCQFNNSKIAATMESYVSIDKDSEEKLMEAIATVGPVSVAIDAPYSLYFYHDGVFSDSSCDPAALNHGVLAVGYGTDDKEGDYWIVKNSWSDKWGDAGYFKLARNKHNMCGVATAASYPVV